MFPHQRQRAQQLIVPFVAFRAGEPRDGQDNRLVRGQAITLEKIVRFSTRIEFLRIECVREKRDSIRIEIKSRRHSSSRELTDRDQAIGSAQRVTHSLISDLPYL